MPPTLKITTLERGAWPSENDPPGAAGGDGAAHAGRRR
jgi:hypothetical protein